VIASLKTKMETLKSMGVHDIIIDPGFGFGKTNAHNFQLLKNLNLFKILKAPVLAGVSRKSMINKTLNIKPQDALNGTTALNMVALMNGANILRVHDVKEAMETIQLFNTLQAS
jgi:dihydropteroate synthase